MSLPRYNLQNLKDLLRSNRVMVLAVHDTDTTKMKTDVPPSYGSMIPSVYNMQAMLLDLEAAADGDLVTACIDNTRIPLELDKANTYYDALFIGLSATANILTIEGWDVFYIPRRMGQTMPPSDVRLFDPSQTRPAYHISSYESIETNFKKLAEMADNLVV